MLFESQEGRVAQQVFQTLSDRIRQTNYKINDQEKRAFANCSTDVGGNLLMFGGGFAATGYVLAQRAAGAGKSSRWGRFIATTAGFYLGTQVALRGVKEGCLERIVALPTPLGSEAAAILREKAPNSKLLAGRPADFQDGTRLPTAASAQQAHEQAGVAVPDSAQRPAPSMRQPQLTRQQVDEGQQAQPDALGGLGAFDFAGDDEWGTSETEDTPLGLDTVRRSKRKHRRSFTRTDCEPDESNPGVQDTETWDPWASKEGNSNSTTSSF